MHDESMCSGMSSAGLIPVPGVSFQLHSCAHLRPALDEPRPGPPAGRPLAQRHGHMAAAALALQSPEAPWGRRECVMQRVGQ